jgi:thymidine kinase
MEVVETYVQDADVIGIEGAHRGDDRLLDLIRGLRDKHRKVLVTACMSDERQRPYEVVTQLMARADKVHMLTAKCCICDYVSTPFMRRTEAAMIYPEEMCEAACRRCLEFVATKE